jgi:hypothetical protein
MMLGVIKRACLISSVACCFGLPGCMPDGEVILPMVRSGSGASDQAGTGSMAGGGASGRVSSGSPAGSGAAGSSPGAAGGVAGRAAAGGTGGASGAAGRGRGASGTGGSASGTGGSAAGSGTGGGGAGGAGGSRAGAGGGGSGGGRAGAGGAAGAGAGGGGGGSGAPTFTEVYALIRTSCNGCHGSGQGGLNTMTQDAAYMNLVGADSGACAGKKRVVARDLNASVLYLAINRTAADGCDPPDMPRGGSKWDQASIDKVKAWIEAGAMK